MSEAKPGLLYPEESYAILGACFEVYKHLGSGLPEAAYQQALGIESKRRGIDAKPHPTIDI
ncbi:MAG: GxxExxY protein [Gemmataceae bacterium]|nr:GxxExxY protein [Gemmataceae bacterium]